MRECDIAVVGAGPAGATTAAVLAGAGVDVVVVDRKSRGEEKPCAGGLLRRGFRCLPRDLNVPWLDSGVDELIVSQGDHYLRRRVPAPLIRTVLREDFDAALMEHAERRGADVMTGVRVEQVEQDTQGVTLTTDSGTIRARVVIGADGASSTVGHRCGMVRKLDLEPSMVMRVVPRDMEPFRRRAHIDFNSPPFGYAWIFPKADHLSVGAGAPGASKEAVSESAEILLGRCVGADCRIISRTFACIPMPSSDIRRASGRVVLVGDAAGLVDPFTREGISWAMESGRLAAKAALGFLQGRCKLQVYEQMLERRLLPELRAAGGIVDWAYEDPARAHRWLRERWYFWHGFCALLSGHISHRTLLTGLRVMTRVTP